MMAGGASSYINWCYLQHYLPCSLADMQSVEWLWPATKRILQTLCGCDWHEAKGHSAFAAHLSKCMPSSSSYQGESSSWSHFLSRVCAEMCLRCNMLWESDLRCCVWWHYTGLLHLFIDVVAVFQIYPWKRRTEVPVSRPGAKPRWRGPFKVTAKSQSAPVFVSMFPTAVMFFKVLEVCGNQGVKDSSVLW